MDSHPSEQARAVAAEVTGWPAEGLRVERLGEDRGVFSHVCRVAGPRGAFVVKLPRSDANGEAARRSGAYERERIAYDSLLGSEVPAPVCAGIVDLPAGPAFVLEDLSDHRQADQVEGLAEPDVQAVVDALVRSHRCLDGDRARSRGVRVAAPGTFSPDRLRLGTAALDPELGPVFGDLLAQRPRLLARFTTFADPVCCHGDPRADNVVFGGDGGAILLDWQQIAVQIGEADLAWLLATSTRPEVRRSIEVDAVRRYAAGVGRPFDQAWERYRSGLLVPGLAVLLLVQRQATGRMADIVVRSVERISSALIDHIDLRP